MPTSTNLNQQVPLVINGTDNEGGSGIASMCLTESPTAITNCSPFVDYATSVNFTLADNGIVNRTIYLVMADVKGNIGQAARVDLRSDLSPPSGVVKINGDAASTGSVAVSLTITGDDGPSGSGVSTMCISNAAADAAACGAFVPLASPVNWTLLAGGSGPTRTVYVWLRDAAGNTGMATASTGLDLAPPTGVAVSINGGQPFTTSRQITLTITATDLSGVTQMCVAEAAAGCTSWQPFVSPTNFTLADGADGSRTVYVSVKDAVGNTADPVSASISLDRQPPLGSVVINQGRPWTNSLTVNLAIAANDSAGGSGLQAMCISETVAGAACTPFTPFVSPVNFTLASGAAATNRTVYVSLRDQAGSVSVAAASVGVELTPPSAAVLINSGAAWTGSLAVSLTITGDDGPAGSGVSTMCISNAAADAAACGAFVPLASPANWTLLAGGGGLTRTVYAWVCDTAGNCRGAQDTIQLDTQPPTVSSVTLNGGQVYARSRVVTLTTTTTDASGVAQMCMSEADTGCTSWQPFASPTNFTLAEGADGNRTVYVSLRDVASNQMQSPAQASIWLDFQPPVDTSVVVADGAAFTPVSKVSLSLSALDAGSGVSHFCLSKTPTTAEACKPWEAYKETPSVKTGVTLSSTKLGASTTFHVFFRDQSGQATPTPATATVTLDNAAPAMVKAAVNLRGSTTSTAATLTWAEAATDAGGSGLDRYVLLGMEKGTPPSKCVLPPVRRAGAASILELYSGLGATSATAAGLKPGTSYGFRLCAIDGAGNAAAGLTLTLKTPKA
jgi:hypothetical protein